MVNPQTKQALLEALTDTAIAAIINVPMNFVLLYLCIDIWEMGTIETSLMMTLAFTVYAILRKTYVRLYFAKRSGK